MYQPIAPEVATALLKAVLAFREREAATPVADAAALLELFPRVRVREGFVLDYVQDTTSGGVRQPTRPFARPAGDDTWVPVFEGEPGREDLVEQLYRYLEYEPTPEGLFEYAFFVIELWSLRMSRHAAEWLESTPIFSEEEYRQTLEGGKVEGEVHRPSHFGPLARLNPKGGGRVRFLVHTPMGWARVYYLESLVAADGYVDQEAGEIVADMGTGLIF